MGNYLPSCCSTTSSDPYLDATFENTPEYTLAGLRTQVKVLRILDGDTVDIALYHPELGRNYRHRVRLYGIDTPEKRPPKDNPDREQEMAASARSTNALRQRMLLVKNLPDALFYKPDKYGRLLCTFYEENDKSINDWMIAEGYAYAYEGKTKKKFSELSAV